MKVTFLDKSSTNVSVFNVASNAFMLVFRDDDAFINNGDIATQHFCFFEVVGGKNDRHTLAD